MAQALRLGRRNMGATGANPAVGCVIVKDGAVVGAGWTAPGGRPHAEVEALKMAGVAARGATAYVTLEPCSHHGRSAPCAEALAAAGLSRVVAAIEDPDPRVKGGGLARLRAAGIEVATGIRAEEAREDLAGFLSRIERGRPHVLLKLAMSRDGKVAERPGVPTAITGEAVRRRVHLARAQSDAVLIGVSTAIADDPLLTVRLPGLEARSPIRVVSDSTLKLPPAGHLARTARETPTWILCLAGHGKQVETLRTLGIDAIECAATLEGKVDLPDGFARLAARGVKRVLAEGGAHMAKALIEADLVDEAHFFTAPQQLGPEGLDALAGLPLATITASPRFALWREEQLGDDKLAVYRRVSEGPAIPGKPA